MGGASSQSDPNMKKELYANKVSFGDKGLSNAYFKTTYQA